MLKFQAFDKYKAVVCEIYCLHGEVVRICSWKYAKVERIFDEYKDTPDRPRIQMGHFKQVINTFCRDFEFNEFENLLNAMTKDEEYQKVAKTIIARYALLMDCQAKKLNSVIRNKK